jgi:ABC-type cobalamin/Fe3+-siderophores transport system ATPase subunit
MNSQLIAEKINFAYPDTPPLLKDFSLALEPLSFTGLIGPNGAGKTTVFKILSGSLTPHSGSVSLNDRPIRKIPHRERASCLAMVPQFVATPMPYTVRQIVEMGRISRLSRFGLLSRHDRDQIERAMHEMDIIDMADRPFSNLSGGERQRTVTAASLAQEPEILLLDEPTASLDLGHSVRLMELLTELRSKRGMAIMLISHDIQLCAHYCSRLVLLRNGKITADGSPEEVVTPKIIGETYQCRVETVKDSAGRPLLSLFH